MPLADVTELSDEDAPQKPEPTPKPAPLPAEPTPEIQPKLKPKPKGKAKAKTNASPKPKAKGKSKAKVLKRPSANVSGGGGRGASSSLALDAPMADGPCDGEEDVVMKRPSASAQTGIRANKYIYQRDGVWGNKQEIIRVRAQPKFQYLTSGLFFCMTAFIDSANAAAHGVH